MYLYAYVHTVSVRHCNVVAVHLFMQAISRSAEEQQTLAFKQMVSKPLHRDPPIHYPLTRSNGLDNVYLMKQHYTYDGSR